MADFKQPRRIVDPDALASAKLFFQECALCGATQNLHVHHVLFRSQGGDDVRGNLCALCQMHHDEIHANKRLAWFALKAYCFFERPDTLEYLERKLGFAASEFFGRGHPAR